MVRQRKQSQEAHRGSSSPRRKPPAAARPSPSSEPGKEPPIARQPDGSGTGTGSSMQYVSNSRSKARLLQSSPSKAPGLGLCRWLWRPRRARLLVLVLVLAGAGFVCGRAFYRHANPSPELLPGGGGRLWHQDHRDQRLVHHQRPNGNGPPMGPMGHEETESMRLARVAAHQALHYQQQQQLKQQQQQLKQQQQQQFHQAQQGAQQHQQPDFHQQQQLQQQLQQQQQQHKPQPQSQQQQQPVQAQQQQQPQQQQQQQQPVQAPQQQLLKPAAANPAKNDAPSNLQEYPYHIIQTLTNTEKLPHLKTRFIECTKSILDKASINLHFFFVVDEGSKKFVKEALQDITNQGIAKNKFQFHFIMVEDLAHQLAPLVTMLLESVTGGHPYYQDTIFYLSVAIHRGVLPAYVKRVIMLDTDLKFMTDIGQLFGHFSRFGPDAVMGLAREMQPVYRHLLSLYRSQHRGTLVGGPPPDGLTGFNSGVVLLDLERMKASAEYRGFLAAERVKQLAAKYSFKGHLGDQDLFSLISLERPGLFYVLPCSWNRQLCQWWRDKGYKDVFDQYYQCPGTIHIYHGNCNTPIPY